MLNGGMNRL